MIKKFITLTTTLAIISTLMFPMSLQAITAEDRLIEVERQLQAIADQISKYEGDKTDLEKAILENDQDLQQVNRELAEVQSRLQAAEREEEGLDVREILVNQDFIFLEKISMQK